ncbi:MAG: hypothetical protein P8077_02100 [Gammaproteobacteria bacterium]
MDIEFHYYITAYLAHKAGFSQTDAQVLAYASQYVDENDVCFHIVHRSSEQIYRNFISQTMNILKPKQALMRIYPIFHFVPGEPDAPTARRSDGKRHVLNTTPNSENANELMHQAIRADRQTRLYRIGIASHAYVDTWAHQNFVGWYDQFNQVGSDPKPNIGHADGEHHPDWVSHRWCDDRLLDSEVNNRHRFLSAAKELFAWLCCAEGRQEAVETSTAWPTVFAELSEMMGPTYTGRECKFRQDRTQRYGAVMPWLKPFDEREWFDQAIESEVRGQEDTHEGLMARFTLFEDRHYWREDTDHQTSHWFCFQEAVKEHEQAGIKQLTPCFAEMGYKLAQT